MCKFRTEPSIWKQDRKSLCTQLPKLLFISACAVFSAGVFSAPVLSVNGSKVVQDGQEVSLAGMSMFWSNNGWGGERFYDAQVVNEFATQWDAKIVRAVMGVEDPGGYIDDPVANKARIKTIIDAAIAEDIYVIIDWHSHHAEQHEAAAISFFEEMAATYGNSNNVIYEIYNEPLAVDWSSVIKPYAINVINAIRAIDQDNLIIVGTPNWSQDVDIASNDPITGQTNIAYTLHYYSASHGSALRAKAEAAMSNGIALFVTEQGNVDASGAGSLDVAASDIWYQWLKDNKISFANWAMNDKDEAASILNCGSTYNQYGDCTTASPQLSGWTASELTDSGEYIKDTILNWNAGYANHNLPAIIQAEDYHAATDNTSHNEGGSPTACIDRGMGVDLENTSDTGGGCNVGWTGAGETISYNIGTAGGTYDIRARLAGMSSGNRIKISVNGSQVGEVNTAGGGWQAWTNESILGVSIPNNATLTVEFLDGGVNFNYLDITSASNGNINLLSSGGTFTSGQENFGTYLVDATASFGNGDAWFDIASASAEIWQVQLTHAISVASGQLYTVCYDAWTGAGGRSINVNVDDAGTPSYASLMNNTHTQAIGAGWNSYSHTFTATGTDATARLAFNLGQSAVNMSLDNVGLYEGSNCGTP